MKKRKREISTVVAVGVSVVIGIIAIVSSFFVNQKKTTYSKAAEPVCSSKPNIQPAPPAEKEWVADCNKSCTANNQCDFGIGTEKWSRWCYGFSNGSKCMKQVYKSGVNPPLGSGTTNPSDNGCFSLKSEFEVKNENGKSAFYAWVTFSSSKGGDVQLQYNNIHVAGWNGFAGGGSYTYDPKWTQPHTHESWAGIAALDRGGSVTANYRGMLSSCQPQSLAISCVVGVKADGSTYVTGNGCSCKNCTIVTAPTTPPVQSPTSPQASSSPSSIGCGGKTPIQSLCSSFGSASGTYCLSDTNPNKNIYYVISGVGSYSDKECKNSIIPLSYCCTPKTACGGPTPIPSNCFTFTNSNPCPTGSNRNSKPYYITANGGYAEASCTTPISLSEYCCDPPIVCQDLTGEFADQTKWNCRPGPGKGGNACDSTYAEATGLCTGNIKKGWCCKKVPPVSTPPTTVLCEPKNCQDYCKEMMILDSGEPNKQIWKNINGWYTERTCNVNTAGENGQRYCDCRFPESGCTPVTCTQFCQNAHTNSWQSSNPGRPLSIENKGNSGVTYHYNETCSNPAYISDLDGACGCHDGAMQPVTIKVRASIFAGCKEGDYITRTAVNIKDGTINSTPTAVVWFSSLVKNKGIITSTFAVYMKKSPERQIIYTPMVEYYSSVSGKTEWVFGPDIPRSSTIPVNETMEVQGTCRTTL